MATIQIKRRTTVGSGPLTGNIGTVKAGEPLVDFTGGHLYIAKADKNATTQAPLAENDYMSLPSVEKVNTQIDTKITALSLGTASTKNIGTTNGCIPVLDTNGKLVDSVIPKIALTNTFVVATEAAMLALSTAQEGDVAVRTDLNKSFILKATGYSTLVNWQELLTPTDAVTSVNGKKGSVSISLSELGGVASSTYNTHVGSEVHLTETQLERLENMRMFDMNSETGGVWITDKTAWANSVIGEGLRLHAVHDFNYNPAKTTVYIGIDKDKVLQPTSVIDGGTY